MVGELVPLLTAPGTLDERLRLVAHRLSSNAGYDGVNFDVLVDADEQQEGANAVANQNAFVKASDELVDAWNEEQRTVTDHPVGQILRDTGQPVYLDDLATDPRLTETQRTLLSTIGLVSGIAVPIMHAGEFIGTLSAGSKVAGFFTPREGAFLMGVASQIAAIIHMARVAEEHHTEHRLAA
jgi:GAF domain-containing protein